jgi:hypothetical protein
MLEEGTPQSGHGEVDRCEVTRTTTSSDASLSEVISRPSGKGNSGVIGIPCHLLQHVFAGAYRQDPSFSMAHQKPGRAIFSSALTKMRKSPGMSAIGAIIWTI